ncbi:hypothetical protein HK405_008884, partial [Cladochytrium tenue]
MKPSAPHTWLAGVKTGAGPRAAAAPLSPAPPAPPPAAIAPSPTPPPSPRVAYSVAHSTAENLVVTRRVGGGAGSAPQSVVPPASSVALGTATNAEPKNAPVASKSTPRFKPLPPTPNAAAAAVAAIPLKPKLAAVVSTHVQTSRAFKPASTTAPLYDRAKLAQGAVVTVPAVHVTDYGSGATAGDPNSGNPPTPPAMVGGTGRHTADAPPKTLPSTSPLASIKSYFKRRFPRKKSVAAVTSRAAVAPPKDAVERLTRLLVRILRESKRPAELLESLKAANMESQIQGGGRLVNLLTNAADFVVSDDGQKRISDALDKISKLEGGNSKDPLSRPVQAAIDGIGNILSSVEDFLRGHVILHVAFCFLMCIYK